VNVLASASIISKECPGFRYPLNDRMRELLNWKRLAGLFMDRMKVEHA
jgi:hypothetical protein